MKFDNTPTASLIDELGQLKAIERDTKKRLDALREEILARGVKHDFGAMFELSVVSSVRQALDTKALKEEMGSEWYSAHCKPSNVVTLNVKPIPSA